MAITTLSPLPLPDGSATHTQNGHTILGAVNGPIEVQRRDELAEEAAIEVNVRPAVGVGGRSPSSSRTVYPKMSQTLSSTALSERSEKLTHY